MEYRDVWEKFCGQKSNGRDYVGRKVIYSAYRNRNSLGGWDVEYIKPLANGGRKGICNVHIVNIQTKDERCETFPEWDANGKRFLAVETVNGGYTVKEI